MASAVELADWQLNIPAAGLSGDHYPVAVDQAGWRLAERDSALASPEYILFEGVGCREDKRVRANDQPLQLRDLLDNDPVLRRW